MGQMRVMAGKGESSGQRSERRANDQAGSQQGSSAERGIQLCISRLRRPDKGDDLVGRGVMQSRQNILTSGRSRNQA